ncbi:MAG: FkbM family methyltransferase [Bryobacteraceae bacterium]
MPSRIERFNATLPWPVRGLIVVVAGMLIWMLTIGLFPGVLAKVNGKAEACSWPRILMVPAESVLWTASSIWNNWSLSVVEKDDKLDLQSVSSPQGKFWLRAKGTHMDARHLLAYLFTEHGFLTRWNRANSVRKGDVVLDCGAHVGVFTYMALQAGAEKVVAIEPDPVNRVCLQRNFMQQIADGRVVVVSKGVWSAEGALKLFLGAENSGTSSIVLDQGAGNVEIEVTTIDKLVESLKLSKVTYIKMDIEGAEREALKGAVETLKRFKPRMMIDSYHRPDDMQLLPGLIRGANPAYNMVCGPCQPRALKSDEYTPHVVYYE